MDTNEIRTMLVDLREKERQLVNARRDVALALDKFLSIDDAKLIASVMCDRTVRPICNASEMSKEKAAALEERIKNYVNHSL